MLEHSNATLITSFLLSGPALATGKPSKSKKKTSTLRKFLDLGKFATNEEEKGSADKRGGANPGIEVSHSSVHDFVRDIVAEDNSRVSSNFMRSQFPKLLAKWENQNGAVEIEDRRQLWEALLGGPTSLLQKNSDKTYKEYVSIATTGEPLRSEVDIRKDTNRTHILAMDEPGMEELLTKLLLAYAARNPEVGYCQGMNFICAMLLQVFGKDAEELIFWSLCVMLEELIPHYHDFSLLGVRTEQRTLNTLLLKLSPQLHAHLQRLNLSQAYLTTEWLVGAFVTSVPPGAAHALWDLLFSLAVEGEGASLVLLAAALALMELNTDILLRSSDCSSALRLVKHALSDIWLQEPKSLQRHSDFIHSTVVILRTLRKDGESILRMRKMHREDLEDEQERDDEQRHELEVLREVQLSREEITALRREFDFLEQQQTFRQQQQLQQHNPLAEGDWVDASPAPQDTLGGFEMYPRSNSDVVSGSHPCTFNAAAIRAAAAPLIASGMEYIKIRNHFEMEYGRELSEEEKEVISNLLTAGTGNSGNGGNGGGNPAGGDGEPGATRKRSGSSELEQSEAAAASAARLMAHERRHHSASGAGGPGGAGAAGAAGGNAGAGGASAAGGAGGAGAAGGAGGAGAAGGNHRRSYTTNDGHAHIPVLPVTVFGTPPATNGQAGLARTPSREGGVSGSKHDRQRLPSRMSTIAERRDHYLSTPSASPTPSREQFAMGASNGRGQHSRSRSESIPSSAAKSIRAGNNSRLIAQASQTRRQRKPARGLTYENFQGLVIKLYPSWTQKFKLDPRNLFRAFTRYPSIHDGSDGAGKHLDTRTLRRTRARQRRAAASMVGGGEGALGEGGTIFDTHITFADFAHGISRLCHGDLEEQLRILFEAYDDHGLGRISRAQMVAMVESLYRAHYEGVDDDFDQHYSKEIDMRDDWTGSRNSRQSAVATQRRRQNGGFNDLAYSLECEEDELELERRKSSMETTSNRGHRQSVTMGGELLQVQYASAPRVLLQAAPTERARSDSMGNPKTREHRASSLELGERRRRQKSDVREKRKHVSDLFSEAGYGEIDRGVGNGTFLETLDTDELDDLDDLDGLSKSQPGSPYQSLSSKRPPGGGTSLAIPPRALPRSHTLPNKSSQSMLDFSLEKAQQQGLPSPRMRAGSMSKAARMLGMDPSFEEDKAHLTAAGLHKSPKIPADATRSRGERQSPTLLELLKEADGAQEERTEQDDGEGDADADADAEVEVDDAEAIARRETRDRQGSIESPDTRRSLNASFNRRRQGSTPLKKVFAEAEAEAEAVEEEENERNKILAFEAAAAVGSTQASDDFLMVCGVPAVMDMEYASPAALAAAQGAKTRSASSLPRIGEGELVVIPVVQARSRANSNPDQQPNRQSLEELTEFGCMVTGRLSDADTDGWTSSLDRDSLCRASALEIAMSSSAPSTDSKNLFLESPTRPGPVRRGGSDASGTTLGTGADLSAGAGAYAEQQSGPLFPSPQSESPGDSHIRNQLLLTPDRMGKKGHVGAQQEYSEGTQQAYPDYLDYKGQEAEEAIFASEGKRAKWAGRSQQEVLKYWKLNGISLARAAEMHVERTFRYMDRNGDGTLSYEEWFKAVRRDDILRQCLDGAGLALSAGISPSPLSPMTPLVVSTAEPVSPLALGTPTDTSLQLDHGEVGYGRMSDHDLHIDLDSPKPNGWRVEKTRSKSTGGKPTLSLAGYEPSSLAGYEPSSPLVTALRLSARSEGRGEQSVAGVSGAGGGSNRGEEQEQQGGAELGEDPHFNLDDSWAQDMAQTDVLATEEAVVVAEAEVGAGAGGVIGAGSEGSSADVEGQIEQLENREKRSGSNKSDRSDAGDGEMRGSQLGTASRELQRIPNNRLQMVFGADSGSDSTFDFSSSADWAAAQAQQGAEGEQDDATNGISKSYVPSSSRPMHHRTRSTPSQLSSSVGLSPVLPRALARLSADSNRARRISTGASSHPGDSDDEEDQRKRGQSEITAQLASSVQQPSIVARLAFTEGGRDSGSGNGLAEQTAVVMPKPKWVDSALRKACSNPKCITKFPEGLIGRVANMKLSSQKHHCRHCGEVFCGSCTQQRSMIPHLGYCTEPVSKCSVRRYMPSFHTNCPPSLAPHAHTHTRTHRTPPPPHTPHPSPSLPLPQVRVCDRCYEIIPNAHPSLGLHGVTSMCSSLSDSTTSGSGCQGFLWKRGEINRSWKKRWFILVRPAEDMYLQPHQQQQQPILYYFDTQPVKQPQQLAPQQQQQDDRHAGHFKGWSQKPKGEIHLLQSR
jgi:Ca2+-binding EF-hand superfamily protein